ncbi:11538_t:CDS:1, partial [Gigaspora rosea]
PKTITLPLEPIMETHNYTTTETMSAETFNHTITETITTTERITEPANDSNDKNEQNPKIN